MNLKKRNNVLVVGEDTLTLFIFKQCLSPSFIVYTYTQQRMSLETIITLAISMGRTIVLPPEKRIYLLWENKTGKQKHQFTFRDFFHLEEVEIEHQHLKFISMEEYLNRFAMKGLLKDTTSGKVIFPPNNRTNWDQTDDRIRNQMWKYIRSTSYMDPSLKPMNSFSYFPANDTDLSPEKINQTQQIINDLNFTQYMNNPTPVDANISDRLKEHMSRRKQVLFYDNEMQKHKFIHFKHDQRNLIFNTIFCISFL